MKDTNTFFDLNISLSFIFPLQSIGVEDIFFSGRNELQKNFFSPFFSSSGTSNPFVFDEWSAAPRPKLDFLLLSHGAAALATEGATCHRGDARAF